MPERVLVTGGAGFIGAHTARALLEAGAEVRLLDNLSPQVHPGSERPAYLPPDVPLVRADVRDHDAVVRALRGVDHVIHLAAETSVGQSLYLADRHVDVNVHGTAVVLRAAAESGVVESVVIASSRAVYGEGRHRCPACGPVNPAPRRPDDLAAGRWAHRCPCCRAAVEWMPTDEDSPPAPASVYGLTKRFQEDLGLLHARQRGGRVVVLRYTNVYGPWQSTDNPYTGLITTLAARLAQGRSIVLYERGVPVRDFVHVEDVATANVLAVGMEGEGAHVFNVGTGAATDLVSLAAALGRAFGVTPDVELSDRHRIGDILANVADISRIRESLGFAPLVGLDEGLSTMARWLESTAVEDRSDAVEAEMRRRGVLRGA